VRCDAPNKLNKKPQAQCVPAANDTELNQISKHARDTQNLTTKLLAAILYISFRFGIFSSVSQLELAGKIEFRYLNFLRNV